MRLFTSNGEESLPLMNSRNSRKWIPLFKRFIDEKVFGKYDAMRLKELNKLLEDSSEDETITEFQQQEISPHQIPCNESGNPDQSRNSENST
eukprot:g8437.t1